MIKKIYPHNILQAITLIIISMVFTAPILFLEKQIGHEMFSLICFVIFCLMAIGITIIINRKNKMAVHFNFSVIKPKLLFISILILFLFHLGLNRIITWAFVHFFTFKASVTSDLNLPLLFGMLLAAPILEELLFRGIILKGFLSNYGVKMAFFSSVIMFAVFHGSVIQGTHAFLVGSLISYIYFRERSLTMPVLLHFSSNLIAGISMYWNSKHRDVPMTELYGTFTIPICILATTLFFFTVWWLFKKGYPKSYPQKFN